MGDFIEKGVTFQSGSQLTHTDLNNLVDNATIKNKAIGYPQLKDGSIAESIFGYPLLPADEINDADYYLIWSATNNSFRKIKKTDFANSLNSLVSEWFETFFEDKEGTILSTLTQAEDVLNFEGNEFSIKAKYEDTNGRVNISGRLDAPDGVLLYNTWVVQSDYGSNKFIITPDQDNVGGEAVIDLSAKVAARSNISIEATNGNTWNLEPSTTNNQLNIKPSDENSGGDAKVYVEGDVEVTGNSIFKQVVVDSIETSDGSTIGGAASFFSVDGTSINFGAANEAYRWDSDSGSLYLNSGALGSGDWSVDSGVLSIQTV